MTLNRKIITVCLPLLVFACSPGTKDLAENNPEIEIQNDGKEVSEENYVAFVKDQANDLVQSKEIGDFIYTVHFLPPEYMVLREQGEDTLSKEAFAAKIKEMSELQYFNLTIQNKSFNKELLKFELESESDYFSRIEYFSFKMQNDVTLVDGKDSLACELFHFERTYNIAPYLTFTMAFRNPNNVGDKTFSFDDLVFKNGRINITFDKSTFINIPKIKII